MQWPKEFDDRNFFVENGTAYIRMEAGDAQVLPAFPQYDPSLKAHGINTSYWNQDNSVGHQQRGFIMYWALRAFSEHKGLAGLELGGAGVRTPGCLGSDIVGTGECNSYDGRRYDNVQLKWDATNLWAFGTNSLSCVLSSHVVEHLPCSSLDMNVTSAEKMRFGCGGYEVASILRDWIRVVTPGGYIAAIIPDERPAQEKGTTTFDHDKTHRHAWTAEQFRANIIPQLLDIADLVQYDTLLNNFSFDFTLRKK